MSRFTRAPVALALTCVSLWLAAGCKAPSRPGFALQPTSTSSDYKTYRATGLVLAKSAATGEITLEGDTIPGFMPAMTMVYKLKDPAMLQSLQSGDRISADLLVPPNDDNYLLDKIVVTAQRSKNFNPEKLPAHQLMVGEIVPDLPLVNQDGKTIHLQDYRGKVLLVTFIYTRCPMPTACPRISSHFSEVNDALAKDPAAYASSHLLSITLDPTYDTPPVMRKYGLAYLDGNAAGFSHWEFVDTTPTDLRKLADAFGLEYTVEDNQITHTMQTTLIGPDSKVLQTWEGSDWSPSDVAKAVEAATQKAART